MTRSAAPTHTCEIERVLYRVSQICVHHQEVTAGAHHQVPIRWSGHLSTAPALNSGDTPSDDNPAHPYRAAIILVTQPFPFRTAGVAKRVAEPANDLCQIRWCTVLARPCRRKREAIKATICGGHRQQQKVEVDHQRQHRCSEKRLARPRRQDATPHDLQDRLTCAQPVKSLLREVVIVHATGLASPMSSRQSVGGDPRWGWLA